MTEEGADILKELADYVRKLQDLNSLEQFLCERLDIGRVVIIQETLTRKRWSNVKSAVLRRGFLEIC